MHVIRVSDVSTLQDLSSHWNCLTRGMPFRSWQWMVSWWHHYANANRMLYVLAVYDDSEALVGVAPWYAEFTDSGRRTLRFLGSGEVCSDYQSILSTPEHESDVIRQIADWLLAAGEPDSNSNPNETWDQIDLDGVSRDNTCINALLSQLENAGCSVHRQPDLNCWRVDLPTTWADFVAGFSKSRRRKIRKLEATARERQITMRVADGEAELEQAEDLLIRLHQARRQSLGEPGCFASSCFTGFYSDVWRRLGPTGGLKISWIEQDNRPLAVETYLTDGDTNYLYQSGIDPAALELSPGHLSNMLLLQWSIENSHTGIDFLRGDEPYKAFWGAQPVATQRIRVAANRIAPRLRHGVWLAGVTIKGWIKNGMELVGTG